MPARVLIPVDNQECTVSAIESVRLRKWHKDTKFLLLKIVEDFSALLYANESQHSSALSTEQEEYTYEMRMWLNELTDSFAKVFPDTQSRLERGDVVQRICDTASEWCADYIVIGSHDRELSYRCALSSIAADVICKAPCSVEAIRYRDLHRLLMQEGKITDDDMKQIVRPPSKILLAVDLKPASDDLLSWAGSIGWPEKAQIRLIAVTQPPHLEEISHWHRGVGTLYTKEGQHHKIVEANLRALEEKLSQVCGNKLDSILIRHEIPSTAIIEMANKWEADFVVLGASIDATKPRNKPQSTTLEVAAGLHCSYAVIQTDLEAQPKFSW